MLAHDLVASSLGESLDRGALALVTSLSKPTFVLLDVRK
jgi:hypothetical protein